jgi:hypothetical protein
VKDKLNDSALCKLTSLPDGKLVSITLNTFNSIPHYICITSTEVFALVNDDDNNDNECNLGLELRKCYRASTLEKDKARITS